MMEINGTNRIELLGADSSVPFLARLDEVQLPVPYPRCFCVRLKAGETLTLSMYERRAGLVIMLSSGLIQFRNVQAASGSVIALPNPGAGCTVQALRDSVLVLASSIDERARARVR